MAISDRALFFEAIKKRALTIHEIVDMFDVSSNTARSWVRYPEVEQIPGTYPHAFRYKGVDTLPQPEKVLPGKAPKPREGVKYIEVPNPPDNVLEDFMNKVIYQEVPELNFNQQFLAIDSVADVDELIRKLKSAIVVTMYFREHGLNKDD